ncbi:MAG: hypothetical protein NVSMB21_25150 [Vulcanimicrobiaceae bacterium]
MWLALNLPASAVTLSSYMLDAAPVLKMWKKWWTALTTAERSRLIARWSM